jgi:acetyltransferase-like isoleucine patch superfamily enzyme
MMSARNVAKRIVFAVSVVVTLPLVLLARAEKKVSKSENVFVGLGQLLSLLPGRVGCHLRSAYYFGTLEACSWEVHIGFGSFFSHRAACLGSHVSMGSYCVIGTASIADDVMMASRVSITSGKRQHFDNEGRVTSVPRFDRVTIGRNTWVGEGAIIIANVGAGCIISAGSVVAQETADGQLVGGNPAKPVKAVRDFYREQTGHRHFQG